jgi:hypothetical protein
MRIFQVRVTRFMPERQVALDGGRAGAVGPTLASPQTTEET